MVRLKILSWVDYQVGPKCNHKRPRGEAEGEFTKYKRRGLTEVEIEAMWSHS